MQSLANSVCYAVDQYFTLPNFCKCQGSSYGGRLACNVGIGGAELGASAWFEPCGSPASFGYEAYAKLYGMGYKIGKSWNAQFLFTKMIPYASVEFALASGGARAELAGAVNRGKIDATFSIGFCAEVLSMGGCNPYIPFAPSLPIQLLKGSLDFSRYC